MTEQSLAENVYDQLPNDSSLILGKAMLSGYIKVKADYWDKASAPSHDWIDDLAQNEPTNKSNEDEEDTKSAALETKDNDDDTIGNINPTDTTHASKIGIFILGETGSGKSALSGLLSGNEEIKGAGTVERRSDSISFIPSKYDQNVLFIDTVGTKDSNTNVTDEEIMKHALKCIHLHGINKIRIVWCVQGSTKDRAGTFVREAKFIQSLQIGEACTIQVGDGNPTDDADDDEEDEKEKVKNDAKAPTKLTKQLPVICDTSMNTVSVWDTVLIIKKEGHPTAQQEALKGVIGACTENGAAGIIDADLNKHAFGFTCIDWNFNGALHPTYKWIPADHREAAGFYTAARAKETICSKLEKLPFYTLDWKRDKCTRCGAVGDRRFVHKPCHTEPEWMHEKPTSWKHKGKKEIKHTAELEERVETVNRYHDGQKKKFHAGRVQQLHVGEVKRATVARVFTGIGTLTISEWIWEPTNWDYYTCCNQYKTKKGLSPCAKRWTCCKQGESAEECTNAEEKWSCCKKYVSAKGVKGCQKTMDTKEVYGCCGKPKGKLGCTVYYDCCGGSKECTEYYPCCDQVFVERKQPGSKKVDMIAPKGCVQKCKKCKINWGEPDGCAPTSN